MTPFLKLLKTKQEGLLKKFQGLEARRQNLAWILLAVIVFSLMTNFIYKPRQSALLKLRQEAESLNNRIKELKATIPDVDREKRDLQLLQESVDTSRQELKNLETKLPHQGSLPQLLGELVRQSQGGNIDFTSIKPTAAKAEGAYPSLNLEMKFESHYAGLINYLYRLENLSQFISTDSVTIAESKDALTPLLDISMTLTTLLGDGGEQKSLSPADTSGISLEVKNNPFLSLLKPSKDEKKENEFKLSGILNRGAQSRVIINDEIYKAGDKFGDATVQSILPAGVVLKRGDEEILLQLEHEAR